jgi:hypothetical protein
MKTNTTLATIAQNEEVTLGWNSMPAYGEVMNQLVGTSHSDVVSTLKAAHKPATSSFWSMLSNIR